MERGADELERRGSLVDQQSGEEHGEQRLEREQHGGRAPSGSRASEIVIRSQPTTCEVNASASSQKVASSDGVKSRLPRTRPAGTTKIVVASVASKSGPATRPRSLEPRRSASRKPE